MVPVGPLTSETRPYPLIDQRSGCHPLALLPRRLVSGTVHVRERSHLNTMTRLLSYYSCLSELLLPLLLLYFRDAMAPLIHWLSSGAAANETRTFLAAGTAIQQKQEECLGFPT